MTSHPALVEVTKRTPLHLCALTLKPHVNPVVFLDGIIFEESSILPLVRRTRINPIIGHRLDPSAFIRLKFHIDTKEHIFRCPILRRKFLPNEKIVVVATTGNVYSFEAVEKYNIRCQNMRDLINGKLFQMDDIIILFDPAVHEWTHKEGLETFSTYPSSSHQSQLPPSSQNYDQLVRYSKEIDDKVKIRQFSQESLHVSAMNTFRATPSKHPSHIKDMLSFDKNSDQGTASADRSETFPPLPPITAVKSFKYHRADNPTQGPSEYIGLPPFPRQENAVDCEVTWEDTCKRKFEYPFPQNGTNDFTMQSETRDKNKKGLMSMNFLNGLQPPLPSKCTEVHSITQTAKKPRVIVPRPSSIESKGSMDRGNITSSSEPSENYPRNMTDVERKAVYKRIRKGRKGKGYVRVITNVGHLNIELHCDKVPRTCDNFLLLAERKYFDGLSWHKVIPGFIAQTGDPTGTGDGGESACGGSFKDEIRTTLNHNMAGVVSMANSGRDSNKSQWFVCFEAAPHLDGHHTVFGKVVGGLSVLIKMENEAKLGKPLAVEKVEVLVNPIKQVRDQVLAENQGLISQIPYESQTRNTVVYTRKSGSSSSQENRRYLFRENPSAVEQSGLVQPTVHYDNSKQHQHSPVQNTESVASLFDITAETNPQHQFSSKADEQFP